MRLLYYYFLYKYNIMSIKYYLIHCNEHEERMPHINEIKDKFNKEITIFPGIYTKYVSLDDQTQYIKAFHNKLDFHSGPTFYQSGQIGCYLSHFSLIEKFMNDNKDNLQYDYSVIFEDDVKFDADQLHGKIEQIIQKLTNVDFDILFLGNLNKNMGTPIVDDIYYVDKNTPCWGTHALLIRNKNVKKIFNVNCRIKCDIDNHYWHSHINNELICLVLSPIICEQLPLKSNISG